MKKILFLLLCTVSMYGQISTGQEQEFDTGIKNNSTQTVTEPVFITTQGADGTYGKITLSNLQNKKAFLSTGLLKNGAITINGDPTKFNVTAGIGIISNFDDPENPISNIINFPAFNGVTPSYLNTGNITYIAINSAPAIVMQATPFTAIQRRDLIELGAVIHSNLTTINVINNISSPTNAGINQLHDLFDIVGALNLSGNIYSANGANLQLNKSAGMIGKRGVNFINNWKDPHRLSQAGETALTFRYRTQNGTEGTDRINLDPALYDLNNVLTAVPNNKFTIQTVVMFQTGLTRILYGQNIYDDLQSARNAIFTRSFVIEPNSKENGIIRAYIIMRNTTTSLQSVADATILEAQKFGGVASGGVALTLANIVTALGYTPENFANKSAILTASSTMYPNNDAVIAGLALKANLASPTFTGVPLAPTANAGSNTTQIATTAFVLANTNANGLLEFNSGDRTVWNNGKSDVTDNTSFGQFALRAKTTGGGNSAFGDSALRSNTTGTENTAIGLGSLSSNLIGTGNTAIGSNSLSAQTVGSNNAVVGNYTGSGITNISNSVLIGYQATPFGNTETNEIVIGYNAIGAGSNTVTLGNASITNTKLRGAVTTNGSFINSTAPATNALLANGTTLANPISGSGTAGYYPKFTSSGVLGNSILSESGSIITIAGSIYRPSTTLGPEGTPIWMPLATYGNGASLSGMYGGNEYQASNGTFLKFVVNDTTTANTPLDALILNEKGATILGKLKAFYPIYANDAAADADATLLSGQCYKLTGSRVVYQKP